MPRVKQAAKHARATKAAAVTAFGTAGLGISLAGASANTIPTAGIPQSGNISPNQRFVLGEEEMADVSLATFHLFDKESAGSDMQLAAVVVRRGCGGCRGCRGGRFAARRSTLVLLASGRQEHRRSGRYENWYCSRLHVLLRI